MKNGNILITDDDQTLCYLLKEELINEGFNVDITFDGKYAIENLKKKSYDVLLLDLEMTDVQGEEVLRYATEHHPSLQVIILTAKIEMRTAIQCIRDGAYDFITKPYEYDQLLTVIERAFEHKSLIISKRILEKKVGQVIPNAIIGNSKAICEVKSFAERAANSDSNILLEGETGTGKELFAEFIHNNSPRSTQPLVAINCASLPDQLIESELFGYEKGAFTDAKTSKQGLVEIANGGTLFLDEIGEMSLTLQPKLLRFLENGEYRRIGGVNNLSSDVRVIGASNKNLMEEADNKNFRRDLLFRLNVITLISPPLRERGDDVLLLANYFLKKKTPVRSNKFLSKEAEVALLKYTFPGNVRELAHIIERALIFSEGDEIQIQDLNLPNVSSENLPINLDENLELLSLDEMEHVHIKRVLDYNDWNRETSARALGISQKTLYTKIKKFDLK